MEQTKYNRTYHLPNSPGTTSDDRIAKNVKCLIGRPIVITEKLDGENSGMDRPHAYARSHAAPTTSPWSRMVRQLHANIKDYIDDDMFIFGENMEGIHSIEYENLTSPFYLFGARVKTQSGIRWWSWKAVKEYAEMMNIPTVPVLFEGIVHSENELYELVEKLVAEPSALGGKREGIVVRTEAAFEDHHFSDCVMKWVRKGHVQTDQHWQRNWRRAKIIGWNSF